MSWHTIPGLILTLFGTTTLAQPFPADPPNASVRADLSQLQGYVRGQADAGAFSGVVLVAEGESVVFEQGYGRVDPQDESSKAPGSHTLFNAASAGKMFTATAILQQVAKGALSLDTRLVDVLPDYCNADFAGKVTIQDLLTHTDGAGGIDLFGVQNAPNRDTVKTVADMVALHACRPASFEPGSGFDYDNFGMVILGRVLEVVSGERFEDYLARHIFAPAGMTDTAFLDCAEQERRPHMARGYAEVDGRKVLNCATMPMRGFPAGGQWSTARDLFRFTLALREGRLMPLPLFKQATSTSGHGFGLGFFATDYGPDVPLRDFRWGHGGQGDQITNDVRVYPSTGETVVVLCNCDGPATFMIADFLHRIVRETGQPALPPPRSVFPD